MISESQVGTYFIEMKFGKNLTGSQIVIAKFPLAGDDLWHRDHVWKDCDTAFLGDMHAYYIYNAPVELKPQGKNVKPCLYLITSFTQTEVTLKLPPVGALHSPKDMSFLEDIFIETEAIDKCHKNLS